MIRTKGEATSHFNDPDMLARISENLGEPMAGIEVSSLAENQQISTRGW